MAHIDKSYYSNLYDTIEISTNSGASYTWYSTWMNSNPLYYPGVYVGNEQLSNVRVRKKYQFHTGIALVYKPNLNHSGWYYWWYQSVPHYWTFLNDSLWTLVEVYLPNNIEAIYNCSFLGCDSIETVYYDGTLAEWNRVNKGSYNGNLASAKVVCSINEDGSENIAYPI